MQIEDILSAINKPGRYIGGEWNSIRKDLNSCAVKFALCFPDLYEVGMSNLGIRIIYGLLNSMPDVACERFFSPALDLENILRSKDEEIFSLESRRPLKSFDLVGFSLGYELSFTNVLNILDLGKIPLKADLRDNSYPLIIGGGPCALNPEPMADFFDFFVIGEAEEAIKEIVDLYRKLRKDFKSGRLSKEEMLLEFSAIEGIYVPALKENNISLSVKKRFVRDFNGSYYPKNWMVPFIQVVHDRITLEVMRGCPNRCRFCQARVQYFPCRFRSPENLLQAAVESYKSSGYEEIALGGLSVSDYPQLKDVLENLIREFKDKCVGISLPSIKPKAMLGNLSKLIATIKKTGLTFAPEAGSEKMRAVLGKDFDENDFFKVIEEAYLSGYQHVKLYFMTGLPLEEDSDLEAIIDFSLRVSQLRKNTGNGAAQVNLSVNTMIPKPHTPFQWLGMENMQKSLAKREYLKNKISKYKRLRISFHNPQMAYLEAIFARGDRKLGQVILNAFKLKARFDGWQEHLNFAVWKDAFAQAGVDPESYLKEKSPDQNLPWDFIDTGVSRQSLLDEFKKSIATK